jgi:hypothetical protein
MYRILVRKPPGKVHLNDREENEMEIGCEDMKWADLTKDRIEYWYFGLAVWNLRMLLSEYK